jgi:hypothetical protein
MGAANLVPNLCSFCKFGEPGWVYIPKERRVQGDKFALRATKMYFIGREGSRIYLMWNPEAQKEVRTSSVTFASAPLLDASVERATALPVPTSLTPVVLTSPVTFAHTPSPLQPTVEDVPEDNDGPAAPLNDDDVTLPEQGLSH